MTRPDVVVVGGGIIGFATAHRLLHLRPGIRVVVIEKEDRPAAHQSGRNSGVIHSGVYYQASSTKAKTVAAGRLALLEFCEANGVPFDMCGKVIVAVDEDERPRLIELARRARESGVRAEIIEADRLAELEPHAAGVAALHVGGAGIVDFAQVCSKLAGLVEAGGGDVRLGTQVTNLVETSHAVIVQTSSSEIEARTAVNCAGLHSDRLLRRADGGSRTVRIVPFRGEYRYLADARANLVRSLIYPVPDPRFPFLGVHLTRTIGGRVHAGPNAILALAREGYSWRDVDCADTWDLLRFPGLRRLAARHWRSGAAEIHRSLSPRAFLASLQRLVPAITAQDVLPAPAGVRAQAVDEHGRLVEDFLFEQTRRVVHVLNAPSPAATASLEIGRLIAERTLALT